MLMFGIVCQEVQISCNIDSNGKVESCATLMNGGCWTQRRRQES